MLLAAVPAAAQYDAITREARRDPFILVRLAALSLETPAEQGDASPMASGWRRPWSD
jgi:hypothetical protein